MLASWKIMVCHYVLHMCMHSVSHLFAHSYSYFLTKRIFLLVNCEEDKWSGSWNWGCTHSCYIQELVRKGAGCSRGGSQLTSSEHVYVTRSIMKRAAQNGTSFFISRSLQMVECVLTVFVMFFYKTVHLD